MSTTPFNINELDAEFHLRALGSRFVLRAPLGVPSWGASEKRLIAKGILGKALPDYEQSIRNLERTICQTIGSRFCIATGSGRDAIKLALIGMGLREGERVVLPSFCCLSVLIPIIELGLVPVFADSADDWQIDPESVDRVMQPGDRALIVPHLFGRLGDMEKLRDIARRKGAFVIDDAAQAIGLEGKWGMAGRAGEIGIFSFGLFKPISAMGGGALVTDDPGLYAKMREKFSDALPEQRSRKMILKIFSKTLLRQYTYRSLLLRRRKQQKNAEAASIPKNNEVHSMSQIDAVLAAAQLEKIFHEASMLKEKASNLADAVKETPFLRNPLPDYQGNPRWVVELAPEYASGEFYRQLYSFLISSGIEVQPTYRPLHKFIEDWGQEVHGEVRRSEELSGKLMCLPFSRKIDVGYLSRCLRQFNPAKSVTAKSQMTSMAG